MSRILLFFFVTFQFVIGKFKSYLTAFTHFSSFASMNVLSGCLHLLPGNGTGGFCHN